MKKICFSLLLICGLLLAATASAQSTRVPANGRKALIDADGNGYPDVGIEVNGHYTSLYAYDALGKWYWDLGDGRVYGNVSDPSLLDDATSTTCSYVNNYRATFNNDPFMDSGWIQNHIVCTGVDQGAYQYLIVHKTDPRYTGNPEWAIWGDWEYHALTATGWGNLVRRRFPG